MLWKPSGTASTQPHNCRTYRKANRSLERHLISIKQRYIYFFKWWVKICPNKTQNLPIPNVLASAFHTVHCVEYSKSGRV